MNKNTIKNCYQCKHRRDIPGDAHSACGKPDFLMQGHPTGIKNGWFFYPFNYDPVWCASECNNFEKVEDSAGK